MINVAGFSYSYPLTYEKTKYFAPYFYCYYAYNNTTQ
jgi:hypothetical protein